MDSIQGNATAASRNVKHICADVTIITFVSHLPAKKCRNGPCSRKLWSHAAAGVMGLWVRVGQLHAGDRMEWLGRLNSAISGTSANTNGVSTLDTGFAGPNMEAMRQKVNEMILNGRR
jgi:hypothetical protein